MHGSLSHQALHCVVSIPKLYERDDQNTMIVTWLVLCCLVGLGPFELSADATALPSRLKVGIAPSPYDSLVNHLWAGNKKTSKQFRRLGCSKTDILAAVKELAQSHAGLRSVDRLTETFKSSKRSRCGWFLMICS